LSYQVLARRWRPKNFEELIGQSHISTTLLNAIRGDRVPHALLFTGPRGTGKTSTARILAMSLRCPNAKDFTPCNVCPECEDIATSRSMDVIEIDGASNNGVDAIRELRDSVGFMPSSGQFKIYIIDEVHMLTGSAFNALLKTLEEPPPHVLFIMATTEAQKIPNTVLSRCQRYDFRKIATRLIADHLIENCKGENIQAEPEAVWAIARQGDGSMRDSQSLLDQVISFCDGQLTLAKVTEVLGLTDRGLLTETISALIQRDSQAAVRVSEGVFEAGYDPLIYMKDLLEELRHLLMVKVSPTRAAEIVDLPKEEIARLAELSKAVREEDIHLLFDMALKGAYDLHRAQDARVVLDMILLRMSVAPRIRDLQNLGRNLDRNSVQSEAAPQLAKPAAAEPSIVMPAAVAAPQTKNVVSAAPPRDASSPSKEPTAVSVQHTPAVTATEAVSNSTHSSANDDLKWNDFVDRVRKVNGLVAAKLDHLLLLKMTGQQATLGVPEKYKFLYPQVSDVQFQKKLVNYFNTFWGPGHSVAVQMINPETATALSPTKLQEKKRSDETAALAQKVEDHPLVRQAKSILNTQVKSIREN
jgi:DNA polymerase-3 subunit gamma/tau